MPKELLQIYQISFRMINFEVVLVTTYVTRNEYEVVNTVKRINIEDSINLNSNRILKNYKIMRS